MARINLWVCDHCKQLNLPSLTMAHCYFVCEHCKQENYRKETIDLWEKELRRMDAVIDQVHKERIENRTNPALDRKHKWDKSEAVEIPNEYINWLYGFDEAKRGFPHYQETVQQNQDRFIHKSILEFAKTNPSIDTCYAVIFRRGLKLTIRFQVGGIMQIPDDCKMLFTGEVDLKAGREILDEIERKRNARDIRCPECLQIAWQVDIRDAVWRVICQHCHHYFERNNPTPRT